MPRSPDRRRGSLGQIGDGADQLTTGGDGRRAVNSACDAEVGEPDPPARLEDQVGRLDVTMNHPEAVGVIEGSSNLGDDVDNRLRAEGPVSAR